MTDRPALIDALREVYDPCCADRGISIVDMGVVEDVRLDGRAFDEFRSLDLSFGDEYGVATVQLGKTRVMVRVSSEVVKASADRKFDGVFTISTELSPIASPAFEVGR